MKVIQKFRLSEKTEFIKFIDTDLRTKMFITLKSKMTALYFMLVCLIALTGFFAFAGFYRLSIEIDNLMIQNYKSIKAINAMIEAVERQDSAVLMYMHDAQTMAIELFVDCTGAFTKNFNIEANNITESGEIELVRSLEKDYSDYLKNFMNLQNIKKSAAGSERVDHYKNIMFPVFLSIKKQLESLMLLNEKMMFAKKNSVAVDSETSMYAVLAISFILAGAGFMISSRTIDSIIKPVDILITSVKKVREGDLDQRAPVISGDEIGQLAGEFNNMTARLMEFEKSSIGSLTSEKNKNLAIVKSISDPLIVLDSEYRIVFINKACEDFFDITESGSRAKYFLEMVRNGELFSYISSAGETSDEEVKSRSFLMPKNGRDVYFNVIVSKISNSNSPSAANSRGLVILFHNITDLKNLEKMKDDFIYMISHEFKTPLTSIIMGASLMFEKGLGEMNEKQRDIMQAINDDGERLSKLVAGLLDISKIESGAAFLKMRNCDIAKIVSNSVESFKNQALEKRLEFKVEIEDGIRRISADPEKLSCVLNNLMSNALRYSPEGETVCVSAFLKNEFIYLSVSDAGPGIDEIYREKIFDKFFQIDQTAGESGNIGLGLSIAKGIVEAHGGRIWCKSGPEKGCSFVFTIPARACGNDGETDSGSQAAC